jgi:hypothetical protein
MEDPLPEFRQCGRRAVGASLAALAAASLLSIAPAAAADDAATGDLPTRAVAFLSQQRSAPFAAPEASRMVAASAAAVGGGARAATVSAAAACTNTVANDPRDVTDLDGAAYLVDFDCDTGNYVAAVGTYDQWSASKLDYFALLVDTDNNTSNGCEQADYIVIGYYDLGLVARALRMPSCDDATWTDRGDVHISRGGGTDFVGMVFTAAQIGSPSSIRWWQQLENIYTFDYDRMPDSGLRTTTRQAPAAPAQTVFGYGTPSLGSTGGTRLNAPLVGMAATNTGNGYWLLGGDGGVFSYGDAVFKGSTGGMRLNSPVRSIGADPRGRGYWLLAGDGGIFSFGVPFFGSTGGMRLNKPVVGMAPTKTGNGYWLVASDGGIFSYGDAGFSGSTGSIRLNQPIVGMAADPDGAGYWFVAADGGVFAFDARFHGSPVGRLDSGDRVVGMTAQGANGYALVTEKGYVYAYGSARANGDARATGLRFSAIAAHPTNGGYWLLARGQ